MLTVLLERLFSLIPIEKLITSEKLNWIIQNRFNLIDLVIFVVLLAVVFIVITAFESKNGDRQKARIKKQLEKNSFFIDKRSGIKVTWDIYMGYMYDNDPHPTNIKIFCTKHTPPLLMEYGHCQDYRCSNFHKTIDEEKVKNYIESLLLNERDKITKK